MYDIYVKTYRYIFFFISNRKNRGIYREEPGRRTFDLPDGINYTYAVVEFGIYIRKIFLPEYFDDKILIENKFKDIFSLI